MQQGAIPYIAPLALSAGVLAVLARHTWKRRRAPGAAPLTVLNLAGCAWALSYALSLGLADPSAKLFWANVRVIGMTTVPGAWLLMALEYSGRLNWLTRGRLALLAAIPLATNLLAWTSPFHTLLRSNVRLEASHAIPILAWDFGPWYYINTAYSYLLVLAGTTVLLVAIVDRPGYRGQVGALLAGLAVPWVGSALNIAGWRLFSLLDPTPISFAITGAVWSWAVLRRRLLDLVPVARAAIFESMADSVFVLDARDRVVDLNPAALRLIDCSRAEATGKAVDEVFAARRDLVERLREAREARAEIALGEAGAPRIFDLRISPLAGPGGMLGGRLLVLRDITERKRAEEELRLHGDRLEARARELGLLYRVTMLASEPLDLGTMLERSLPVVLESMEGRSGAIHLLDESGQALHLAAHQGLPPQLLARMSAAPLEGDLVSRVIQGGEAIVVPEIRASSPAARPGAAADPLAYAGVPMRAGGRAVGVLSVFRGAGHPFSASEVALLASVADGIAVAVENGRLRQQAGQLAVVEERQRLARELHDSVTQQVYSLTLLSAAGRDMVQEGRAARAGHYLGRIADTAQQALREMRLLIFELRPPALEEEGLAGALRARLETVEGRSGLEIHRDIDCPGRLPAPVEAGLYRLAQEALNNAVKHARAGRVAVTLGCEQGWVRLEIADDGVGFDPAGAPGPGGFGLRGMQERVSQLGGRLTIQSRPGGGTRVLAEVPL